jgi:hypothetical protein
MRYGQFPITHLVMNKELMNGDISSLMALQREIQDRGFELLVFMVDKRVFTTASARKAEAMYAQRLLSAWPEFLSCCSANAAADLLELIGESAGSSH